MKKIQNTITKKGLIIGIVFLFLSIGFSPIINADGNTIPQAIGSVPITILEYKADGTVKRTVFRISREQADSFHGEMRNTQDLDTKLSIYKKYNLISQGITTDTLKTGMQERAQKMETSIISQFRIINKSPFPPNVYRNKNCSISGIDSDFEGLWFPVPWTLHPRYLFNFISESEYFESKGDLGEFNLERCYSIILIGFVGIVDTGYHNMIRWIEYSGFCVYSQAKSNY